MSDICTMSSVNIVVALTWLFREQALIITKLTTASLMECRHLGYPEGLVNKCKHIPAMLAFAFPR